MGNSVVSGTGCEVQKEKYDKCQSYWYNERFLKGHLEESPCRDLWEDYAECMRVALKQRAEKRAGGADGAAGDPKQ